ncbi:MAG: sigma-70 family RNA polymerase sigma factor [Planctomycetes bacterium]|nr:sigma-70 family RNA polymerase sigma factor [Planctomycetota bacterium]
MHSDLEATERALSEHAGALQRLARALVGRDDADDAVQETWLVYLRSKPAERDGLRGWLSTVLRRRAASEKRDDVRRREREQGAARAEAVDAGEQREREELLRSVTAAVLELDAPQRRVVMMRYFDGLAPREIALALRVEPNVVSTRLTRAHHKLRERLERQFGRQRAWSLLAWAAREPQLDLGWFALHYRALQAFGLAGVLAGGVWWSWNVAPDAPAEPSELETPSAIVELDTRIELPLDEAPPRTEPSESEAPEQPATAPQTPVLLPLPAPAAIAYSLVLDVRDAFERPASSEVLAALPGCSLNHVASTDERGRAVFSWRGTEPQMELVLALADDGLLRRVRVRAGAQQLQLRTFAVEVGDESDKEQRELNESLIRMANLPNSQLKVALPGFAPDPPELSCVDIRTPGSALIEFADPRFLGAPGDFESHTLDARFAARAASLEAQLKSVRPEFVFGTVRGADGAPAAFALVGLRPQHAPLWCVIRTDEAGEFFSVLFDAPVIELHVGGGPHADAPPLLLRESDLKPGRLGLMSHTVELQLPQTRPKLRGRLIDKNGKALSAWRVYVETAEREFAGAALTDAEGRFSLLRAPLGLLQLHAAPAAGEREAVPLLVERGLRATSSEQTFGLRIEAHAALGRAQIEILSPGGQQLEFSWARAWRTDSDYGVYGTVLPSAPGAGQAARVEFDALPPGEYRVEIACTARAPIVIDSLRVLAGATANLAVAAPPSPGRVRFESAARNSFFADFVRRDGGGEVFATTRVKVGEVLELREGEYVVRRHVDGRVEEQFVLVQSGEETLVRF